MENVAEHYLKNLYEVDNPAIHLAKFFCELTSRAFSREEIVIMARLLKSYGRTNLYFAVLDVSDMYERVDGSKSIYGLLAYFCKKRLENRLNGYERDTDLTDRIKETEKSLDKLRKNKPVLKEDPFGVRSDR